MAAKYSTRRPRGQPFEQFLDSRVERIPEAGCWLWTGCTAGAGYGTFNEGGMRYAHRAAYTHFIGPVPPGAHVLHRCDVPLCCNPAHLFVGTPADNMRDKAVKCRARGLPEAFVRQLIAERCAGDPPRVIAARHGMPVTAIYKIMHDSYKWIRKP